MSHRKASATRAATSAPARAAGLEKACAVRSQPTSANPSPSGPRCGTRPCMVITSRAAVDRLLSSNATTAPMPHIGFRHFTGATVTAVRIDSFMELPPSLWPALHRIAGGHSWPPTTREEALAFVEEAKLQFLLPLLCTARDLPAAISEALVSYRVMERLNNARAMVIEEELRRLIEILSGEEIVLLKGADYGHRLYERASLRPMADIDIFVPQ